MSTPRNIYLLLLIFTPSGMLAQKDSTLILKKTISGNISPKSVVAATNGHVYAQNMMYKHTVTVYDQNGNLLQTLHDTVHPEHYGHTDSAEVLNGAPVEAALTSDGSTLWISNYCMHGRGYRNPGCDNCSGKNKFDRSYLYKYNTSSFEKTACIKSGSVPKFLQVSPNNQYLAVSNWSDGTVGIYNTQTNTLIDEVYVGAFPRGIAWSSSSQKLYVAVMGATYVAEISVPDFTVTKKISVGIHPRHICGPVGDSLLIVSLNGEANVAMVSLGSGHVKKIYTGSMPRTMALSADAEYAYVVNYGDNTVSKLSVSKKALLERVTTLKNPIGVTVHPLTGEVWVACYSGFIQIFTDNEYNPNSITRKNKIDELTFGLPVASITSLLTGREETPVKEKTIALSPSVTPVKSKPVVINIPAEHGYYLIAGAFKSKENAARLKQKLSSGTTSIALLPQEQKGLIYVAFGPYTTKEEASGNVNDVSTQAGNACWVYYY